MRSVGKSMLLGGLTAGGLVFALACNNGNGVPQAIVGSFVQGAFSTLPGGGNNPNYGMGCNSPNQFIFVPATTNSEGPDTNNNMNITPTGTSDFTISCTIVPNNNAYNVTATAQITGGTSPGTMTIQGTFTPRSREMADEAGTPNMDNVPIQNIQVDFLDPTKHLQQKNCFAQYVLATNGMPGASLPSSADTFADSNGGRIWASVFCDSPTSLLESQKPGYAGCMMSATFRFENCASHGP